ncbi:MAG: hypothetical protein CM15mV38_1450 [uncultured marine virus]|nr:MAG: hypothetical protein CM15mV38_1450 [uncultured marine virus]
MKEDIIVSIEKDDLLSIFFVYTNPLIRVINTSDVFEYNLGTNNLFSIFLNQRRPTPMSVKKSINSDIETVLVSNAPFEYAHLIKFEKNQMLLIV